MLCWGTNRRSGVYHTRSHHPNGIGPIPLESCGQLSNPDRFTNQNPSTVSQVAADLHKVGVVLHFHKEPGLTDIVYLQPHQVHGSRCHLCGVGSFVIVKPFACAATSTVCTSKLRCTADLFVACKSCACTHPTLGERTRCYGARPLCLLQFVCLQHHTKTSTCPFQVVYCSPIEFTYTSLHYEDHPRVPFGHALGGCLYHLISFAFPLPWGLDVLSLPFAAKYPS